MVIESLINPFKAERKPWEMFFVGAFYSSVAILLSLWVFKPHASLVMVFLTTFACVPIIYGTLKLEEKKDMEIDDEKMLIKEHGKALSFFIFMFLGITISFTLWYLLLPPDLSSATFSIQAKTISDINTRVTGQSINTLNLFSQIFLNNLKVLIFCLIFAFIYGFGAIFILTWNASVIGTAIGNFVRANVTHTSQYFGITSLGVLRYMIHGVPEILAYFIGGLAAGIISIAVINHDFKSEKFQHILIDSTDLLLLSLVVLFIAALIEVFITPILF
ncbi:MAG: stage II sporulation protein M [Nanoarchaeota archaeon]|nr:stage II sporulation protein M [Nanoarchaeota archaeon]MBU1004237.1 stage II sporulation protein M [Nanoarchaeota archaeon]MBU1945874.1 stage II sporulation protein M [Nanoarchaeota archaeon]